MLDKHVIANNKYTGCYNPEEKNIFTMYQDVKTFYG